MIAENQRSFPVPPPTIQNDVVGTGLWQQQIDVLSDMVQH
jgi:hypothetical protein